MFTIKSMMLKWNRRLKILILMPLVIIIFILINHSVIEQQELLENTFFYEPDVSQWYNYSGDQLNGPAIEMTDPRLVHKLLTKFMVPPPNPPRPYRLSEPHLTDPSMGQSNKIKSILKNKRNGIFLEVGALDGETRSNTLYFERFMNWTGLLIEPDPLNFAKLLKKNRRAYLSPTCLSKKPYPEIAWFEQNSNRGKLAEDDSLEASTAAGQQEQQHTKIQVQCFPLYTYLLALDLRHIDYLSLDVEGAELDVLRHLPFSKLNIQTLSVEFAHVPGGKEAVSDFMLKQGYIIDSEVTHPNWLANDFIFKKI